MSGLHQGGPWSIAVVGGFLLGREFGLLWYSVVALIRVFASWYMGGESGLFYWILVYFLLLLGMYLSSTLLKRHLLESKKEFMSTRGRRILWWCLWFYHTLLFVVAAVIARDPFFDLHPYFWLCCLQLIVVNCPLYREKSDKVTQN